eukprot:m.312461 g.312461  ORF g.312461 m.312461 type:complete len:50 (+) comp266501_c0_seq1:80-229(+)
MFKCCLLSSSACGDNSTVPRQLLDAPHAPDFEQAYCKPSMNMVHSWDSF